ncbi:hypothetical protein HF576_02525 [Microbacterium sp. CFH 90308]|uniref:TQXA domain-containing protein n=1 Tax=Microbacterium salsuginis TaxID=2722803 RepID=A0ABX1K8N7_9MICO|nr:hypothetical protein [Microbacterium sp. CFH 90308]NLP82713.1 hypothetical protein [Microbacterium sp. CFH 90308]
MPIRQATPPHPFRRRILALVTTLAIFLAALIGGVAVAAPAHAAAQGAGFGTWAPISRYGWHGSMLIDGVHTYCITPGAPAPTGASTDHGFSGSAAGLSPEQLTRINLLVTKYGQTSDPVQAAAVGWAVKAIANWDETLHAFGYPGDSLAGAIHWTFSALAPEHSRAVQDRAVAYYDEAIHTAAGVASASGSVVFTTDPADHRSGTVRVDATTAATGSLTLTGAVFADTGAATRAGVTAGTAYAIATRPPAEGRSYTVSATGRFSAGHAAAVRHYTTAGGQDTAGPAGPLEFDVAGADAAPRVPPFAPTISTRVASRYVSGGPYIDEVTFGLAAGEWPRGDDGAFLPVTASATVYRTDAEPQPNQAIPPDAERIGELSLVTDAATGPDAPYTATSTWEMARPGFYTAVWTVRGANQSREVAAHTGDEYVWTEAFGEHGQVAVVPAIATTAQPTAAAGGSLSDTIDVAGGIPADGLLVSSSLYRAVEGIPAADTCVPENLVWQSEPIAVTAVGRYTVTSPPIEVPGTYYWQEHAVDAAGVPVHTGICGIANETSRVTAPTPLPTEPAPALAATGTSIGALRGPAGIAIGLLTAGASLLATRRSRFGVRPSIR